MNYIIKDRIEALQQMIKDAEVLEEDVELVASVMPDANIWLDSEVNVNWPVRGIEEVKVVLHAFAKKGALLDRFIESQTNPVWYLNGRNGKIRLDPTWAREEAEGVTCRLIKVGQVTHSYPKYKLVCKDKAGNDVAMTEATNE